MFAAAANNLKIHNIPWKLLQTHQGRHAEKAVFNSWASIPTNGAAGKLLADDDSNETRTGNKTVKMALRAQANDTRAEWSGVDATVQELSIYLGREVPPVEFDGKHAGIKPNASGYVANTYR
jgi:hypothetical protein